MASNVPANALISKGAAAPSSTPTAALCQTGPIQGGDTHGQRRSGGSGNFGAGASLRGSAGQQPRKGQTIKSQHKQSRRYRFTDEDAIAESAAMNSTRNRKGQTSITHLMSFALPPRPTNNNHFHQPRHVKRNPTFGLGSGYHVVDKARYVHANYRFVVDPRRDYHAQSVDADTYLDWNTVLQILASPQSQATACPICLGDPVAPRMARCGHIFCLPCLIRYMHSADETNSPHDKRARWKRCPICEDTVYTSETRPVRWYVGQEGQAPGEHDDIVLRLVVRPAGSTLALPRETQITAMDDNIPWYHAVDVMDFARVMRGSEDYMLAQFDKELAQVEELERHDELMFGDDTEWTKRAMRAIKEAKEKVRGIGNPPEQPHKPEESKARKRPAGSTNVSSDAPEMYRMQQTAQSSNGVAEAIAAQQEDPATGLESSQTQTGTFNNTHHTLQQTASDYYFYHALLHYYLSPLDIRILKTAFGDFSMFPSSILPRVERISTGHVVDDELRKRTKYLAHLPRGCEVAFLECDWTDTVPAEVLEKFKPDIDRRRKRNEEKEAREEKERVRAEKIEDDKRYAAARRRRPSPAGATHSRFKPEDFEPLSAAEAAASAETMDSHGHESTSPIFRQGSGFASLASPGTSPNTARTVWGTARISPTSPSMPAQDIGPPAEDGWLQDWERELLNEDDLVAQLENAQLASTAPPQSHAGAGGAGGKKKKGKKIILMNTNARRGA